MSRQPETTLGYLALVLHAHLPYVRHAEENCLEERWLFEAITETYVPLLQTFESLVLDQIDFRITISLSPTLLSMLDDSLLMERYERHLHQLIELAKKEVARTRRNPQLNKLAVMYYKTFTGTLEYMKNHHFRLIPHFESFARMGVIELMTTAATHGFMPCMETEESIYAQWEAGLATFEHFFGHRPKGVWVPECAFTPGLDRILRQLGITFFFCETHAMEHASPTPTSIHAPLLTGYGVNVFARDRESSSQVWSSYTGYPGDFNYREYYRDIGFDLPLPYIKPYIHPKGIRVNTGIKYFRVTGNGAEKQFYNPHSANDKAIDHADHFLRCREQQIKELALQMEQKPIITVPFDAELFGHWWYEGPLFLRSLCRGMHVGKHMVRLITPSEYLAICPAKEIGALPLSSWGRNGYAEVWLGPKNSWTYRHLHQAEKMMVHLVETFTKPDSLEKRALDLAAKQLLLAQSSDWAFMIDNEAMTNYALKRIKQHIGLFHELYHHLLQEQVTEAFVTQLEQDWPLFPSLDCQVYMPQNLHSLSVAACSDYSVSKKSRKIVMLAWEYPPKVVGGLSRAVYDLSRALVRQGEVVHVFTSYVEGAPEFEHMEGVYVHRIRGLCDNQPDDFLDWVLQLNIAMVRHFANCVKQGLTFSVVHAHDWLVSPAARELKKQYGLQLIATIHATEHGRNRGIFTDLQRQIHGEEWKLTHEAVKVIACSRYMAKEMMQLFELPSEKVAVIANGVDPKQLEAPKKRYRRSDYALPEEKIVLFIGRLVREKGAQLLIEAAPEILAKYPEAKFIIAGKGPMKDYLEQFAAEKGVAEKILFTGFIDDEGRNFLFSQAYLAVFPSIYEPFGIVALEAMTAGTPVIVSDTGGMAEIVQHGENGLKIYPGIVSSLRDQIIFALENHQQIVIMAKNAKKQLVHLYSWDLLAKETRDVYDSLTNCNVTTMI